MNVAASCEANAENYLMLASKTADAKAKLRFLELAMAWEQVARRCESLQQFSPLVNGTVALAAREHEDSGANEHDRDDPTQARSDKKDPVHH